MFNLEANGEKGYHNVWETQSCTPGTVLIQISFINMVFFVFALDGFAKAQNLENQIVY